MVFVPASLAVEHVASAVFVDIFDDKLVFDRICGVVAFFDELFFRVVNILPAFINLILSGVGVVCTVAVRAAAAVVKIPARRIARLKPHVAIEHVGFHPKGKILSVSVGSVDKNKFLRKTFVYRGTAVAVVKARS